MNRSLDASKTPKDHPVVEKLPYQPPQLRRFGSVSELTMSGTTGVNESGAATHCGSGAAGSKKTCP